ncbi:MAG: hypothetical protein KDA28_00525, partial [Phycisphaerales bacterium]|nr:hypothetical protein [Phycisphaerales bacterium]
DEIWTRFDLDLVCLAGYLKFVEIPARWQGRVLNIHPSLLPRHGGAGMYGDRVHRAVLDAADHESGCTVHLCDGAYDQGRILVQRRCPVEPGDTPDTLAARVFELECEAYPEAIRRIRRELEDSRASDPSGGDVKSR